MPSRATPLYDRYLGNPPPGKVVAAVGPREEMEEFLERLFRQSQLKEISMEEELSRYTLFETPQVPVNALPTPDHEVCRFRVTSEWNVRVWKVEDESTMEAYMFDFVKDNNQPVSLVADNTKATLRHVAQDDSPFVPEDEPLKPFGDHTGVDYNVQNTGFDVGESYMSLPGLVYCLERPGKPDAVFQIPRAGKPGSRYQAPIAPVQGCCFPR